MCIQGRNLMGSPYSKSIMQITHLGRHRKAQNSGLDCSSGPRQRPIYTGIAKIVYTKKNNEKSSLSDLFLRAILASVVHALGEVVNEADALCDADLLFFRQLGGQASLTGGGMVHRHVGLLLENKRETPLHMFHMFSSCCKKWYTMVYKWQLFGEPYSPSRIAYGTMTTQRQYNTEDICFRLEN